MDDLIKNIGEIVHVNMNRFGIISLSFTDPMVMLGVGRWVRVGVGVKMSKVESG